ncbi:hypothetical protein FGIG_06481 [Fasciola gigantica]|uniref:Uncharacterized protein n=1 Tax=Fasciola gigantica TaxID=46835 RepID=A0A504YRT5_FASGI|nr:hypothetical protein FGIG_06481 [Fasciola gigantica]
MFDQVCRRTRRKPSAAVNVPNCSLTALLEHVSAVVNESGRVNPPLEDLSSPCNKGRSRKLKTFLVKSQCFLLVNLLEATDTESQGKLNYDFTLLRSHLSRIFASEEEAVANSVRVPAALRLGKQQAPSGLPRPLKVVLSTVDAARGVLRQCVFYVIALHSSGSS